MRQRIRSIRSSAPAAILPLLLAGCASEGPPRPPSLNLPAAVHGLSAHRSGDNVDLAWTAPTRTTDGVALTVKHGAGAMQAEVCRAERFSSPTCTPIARIAAASGEGSGFHDPLPSPLTQGDHRSLVYRVRLVNAAGKGAAWAEVRTVAGPAPLPVRDLRAAPVADGILLRWRPEPGADGGVMLRVSRGDQKDHSTLMEAGHATQPERAGGTIDTGGHAGQEQRYLVFRREAVSLEGAELSLDSETAAVTVPATARLPLPQPPTGLEAVADTLSVPEVDLVWQPPPDPTVTGYRIYREEDGVTAAALNAQPLPGFTYADKTAQPGHTYRYTAAAVNATGETRSAPVTVTLP